MEGERDMPMEREGHAYGSCMEREGHVLWIVKEIEG